MRRGSPVKYASRSRIVNHSPETLATRPDAWEAILRSTAHVAVAADDEAGFTTLIAFSIHKDMLCGASTAILLFTPRSAGRPGVILTARQHKDPPVGCGAAGPVGFSAPAPVRPWTVLALSDGVWKYAGLGQGDGRGVSPFRRRPYRFVAPSKRACPAAADCKTTSRSSYFAIACKRRPSSWASEAGVNAYAFIPNSRL